MNVISNDISSLSVKTTWDISGTTPQILLDNLSTGNDLAACTWWFIALAPGDIPIHEGSEDDPDITGSWTSFTISDSWAKAFNNILWSGAPYSLQTFVKDGSGNIFTITQTASICRPKGNKKTSTNTYGLATCLVEVKCQEARIFFQDTTNATYQGITGTIGASVLRVIYPIDQDGNIPDPFVGANFSTALVPITYSSDNYQFQSYGIYDYEFSDDVHIRIRYQSFNPKNGTPAVTIPVLCNIDLCSLFCEVDKLVNDITTGNCPNAEEAQQKLNLINPKLWLITMGIQQPLCGVDVPSLIEEVKAIGGFECNCCNAPTGIIPTNSSVIDGYNFQVVTDCGDTTGTFDKTGNNIQLILNGVTYTFAFCGDSPAQTTAFSFSKTVSDCVASVCLFVDVTQLAYDIGTAIQNNADLLNFWQTILGNNTPTGDFELIVDGGCIFSSASTYNYTFTLTNIPATTTYAILTGLQTSILNVLNYSFNMAGLAGLQTYLNGLGLGTFSVASGGATTAVITSNTNSNNIAALFYKVGSTSYSASMTKSTSGFVPLSANQVIQNIINYLCGITDAEIITSADYTICYLDPDTGASKTVVVSAGTDISTLITTLLARGCDTITFINSIPTVSCTGISSLFPSSTTPLQLSDVVYGKKGGLCAEFTVQEIIQRGLELGLFNSAIQDAVCNLMIACGGGFPCAPYTYVSAELVDYDTDCPSIVSFTYNFTGSTINITQVGFGNPAGADQFISIQYKLDSDSSYTTLTASTETSTTGVLLTPATAILVAGAEYDFRITNLCASPAVYYDTTISVPGSVYSGSFKVFTDSDPGSICEQPSVILYSSSPYGVGVTMYLDSNLTTLATGNNFIVGTDLNIMNFNLSTAVVGSDTGGDCTVVIDTCILANSTINICSQATVSLYSAVGIGSGVIMFTDSGLTTPAIGYNFVVNVVIGTVYNMNNTNGQVLLPTGDTC